MRKIVAAKDAASVGSKGRKWASVISQNGNSPRKKVTCLSLSILQVGFFHVVRLFLEGSEGNFRLIKDTCKFVRMIGYT